MLLILDFKCRLWGKYFWLAFKFWKDISILFLIRIRYKSFDFEFIRYKYLWILEHSLYVSNPFVVYAIVPELALDTLSRRTSVQL